MLIRIEGLEDNDATLHESGNILTDGVMCYMTSHAIDIVAEPIYKKATTLQYVLSADQVEDYTLVSHITEPGKADRTFRTQLPRSKCPPSKEYGTWVVERMESKRNGKLRKGYTEVEGEAGYEEPMRYANWEDAVVPSDTLFITQPKLDGVRCVAYPDGRLVSRGNIEYIQPHISKAVVSMDLTHPLDCELYKHGETFSNISGAVRRGNEDWLELHVFDVVDLQSPAKDRIAKILTLDLPDCLDAVPSVVTKDPHSYMDKFVAMGYEGAVSKLPNGMWINKRSKAVFKHKPIHDTEYNIVAVVYDLNPDGDEMIKFTCDANGKHFDVVPSWDQPKRIREYTKWRNSEKRYAGKSLTVEHRGFTKNGIPNHPIGKGVRDYEVE